MKKIIGSIVAIGFLLSSIMNQTANAESIVQESHTDTSIKKDISVLSSKNKKEIQLYIDGYQNYSEEVPMIKKNLVLIPFKSIADYTGATLKWNEKNGKVTIMHNKKKIELILNKNVVYVNGKAKKITDSVQSMKGQIYVSLQFISEILGIKTKWSEKQNRIDLTMYEMIWNKYYKVDANGTKMEIKEENFIEFTNNIEMFEPFSETVSTVVKKDYMDNKKIKYNSSHMGRYELNGKDVMVIFVTEGFVDSYSSGTFNLLVFELSDEPGKTFSTEPLITYNGNLEGFKHFADITDYNGNDILKDLGYLK